MPRSAASALADFSDFLCCGQFDKFFWMPIYFCILSRLIIMHWHLTVSIILPYFLSFCFIYFDVIQYMTEVTASLSKVIFISIKNMFFFIYMLGQWWIISWKIHKRLVILVSPRKRAGSPDPSHFLLQGSAITKIPFFYCFFGRRGRKGKDSEKGLCFLIKVRCRTDFVSLKEHASFSPSVVLPSTGGSVEVPCNESVHPIPYVLYLGCLLSAEQSRHSGQTRENSE